MFYVILHNNIYNKQTAHGESVRAVLLIPVSEQRHFSGEEYTWEYKLSEHQLMGWIAISAARVTRLHGQARVKGMFLFTDTSTSLGDKVHGTVFPNALRVFSGFPDLEDHEANGWMCSSR